jgi:hypothetical protein
MMDYTQGRLKPTLPFKSVAGALLFSALLGPIGTLYASVFGGVLMIVLCFIALSGKFYTSVAIFWVVSCIWSVAAVNRYNRNILKEVRQL